MKHSVIRLTLAVAVAALLVLSATPAQAGKILNERFQDLLIVDNPCTGETMSGIVNGQILYFETADNAGGGHLHFQYRAWGTVVGESSGDTYKIRWDVPFVLPNRINENAGGAFNGAFSFDFDAVGLGSAPDFHGTYRVQVTQNANGVPVMEREILSETCK